MYHEQWFILYLYSTYFLVILGIYHMMQIPIIIINCYKWTWTFICVSIILSLIMTQTSYLPLHKTVKCSSMKKYLTKWKMFEAIVSICLICFWVIIILFFCIANSIYYFCPSPGPAIHAYHPSLLLTTTGKETKKRGKSSNFGERIRETVC